MAGHVLATKEARPAPCANSCRDIGVFEHRAFLRQLIKVRSLDEGISRYPQRFCAMAVGNNKDNVGLLVLRFSDKRSPKQHQYKEHYSSSGHFIRVDSKRKIEGS